MFTLMAACFLGFTVLMVSFALFLGFLQWRDDRAEAAEARSAKADSASAPVVIALAKPVPQA
jgi:hypothetical protein